MQKRAIAYHRFSKDKQSNFSIERQTDITAPWAKHNHVTTTDTFNDDGYTARNFDRPDMQRLFAFIKKYKGTIDYLLVADLSRFSRELGDAVNMVKEIQKEYGVRIVSCSRGIVYDVYDHNSFIMMSLEFTFANADNIQRQNNINGGIYAGKKIGHYVSPHTPFGYSKVGEEIKELVINEATAPVVQFIFESYLKDVPVKVIQKQAATMGYNRTGKSVIAAILSNPVYAGMQLVKKYKEQPGGMMPGKWPAIIDLFTWQQVQDKLKGSKRRGVAPVDAFPLKGVLNCYCGHKLTAAPSKSRNGSYYNYYKCNYGSSHNNISATTAHKQFDEILHYMSVPEMYIDAIKATSAELLQQQLEESKTAITILKKNFTATENKLHSLEEKFIANLVSPETYHRLYPQYIQERQKISADIEALHNEESATFMSLQDNLYRLSDLPVLYHSATLSEKHELLNLWFDSKLYYQDKIYRTTFMMEPFRHNELILSEKQLLIVEQKKGFRMEARRSGVSRTIIEPLTKLLCVVQAIKVA